VSAPSGTATTDPVEAGPPPPSGAGVSAQREYERRRDQREAYARERFPRVGGLLLKVVPEPQSTTAWEKGARGERLVGTRLDELADDGVITLHDRRIPRSRANIDHIAVGQSGIYVIDAKNYTGLVEMRDKGGWLSRDHRLYVNGRDQTALSDKLGRQTDTVRQAIGDEHDRIAIHPMLCFANADFRVFAKPFTIRGVIVTWPRAMKKLVRSPGDIGTDQIAAIAEMLAQRLPSA